MFLFRLVLPGMRTTRLCCALDRDNRFGFITIWARRVVVHIPARHSGGIAGALPSSSSTGHRLDLAQLQAEGKRSLFSAGPARRPGMAFRSTAEPTPERSTDLGMPGGQQGGSGKGVKRCARPTNVCSFAAVSN